MSGSQPATVGELHPLHRKALRHPLILDGLSPTSRLRRFVETGSTRHRCASIEDLCLHVLSSFQRTGWSYPPRRDEAPEARSRARAPTGLSSLGEPYNLTSAFQLVSTPAIFFVVFRRRNSVPQERCAPKNGLGVVRARRIAGGSGHRPGHARSNEYTWTLRVCQLLCFMRCFMRDAASPRADPSALFAAG